MGERHSAMSCQKQTGVRLSVAGGRMVTACWGACAGALRGCDVATQTSVPCSVTPAIRRRQARPLGPHPLTTTRLDSSHSLP